MSKDAQDLTPLDVATNPKVISQIKRYMEALKGEKMTLEIDND